MEMRQLDAHRLQILLTREDLSERDLCYDALDSGDPQTRGLFLSLLETARQRANFTPREKVFIEAYPDGADGCIVYLSDRAPRTAQRWRVRRPARVPVIYRFADVDELIQGSVKLFRRCSHRIQKSALYRAGREWRLVIYPLDTTERMTLSFLDEYADRCGEGALAAAWLDEHGELLVARDAVDLLSAYFG